MARALEQRRDEFPKLVKEILARRVGYLCSLCYVSTTGPTTDPNKSSITGVAAHITAAAVGGPRFNRHLTPEERRAASNGLWCCANCGKMVDDDTLRFTDEKLREIKAIAEHAADVRRNLAERHYHELIKAESITRVAGLGILRGWRETYHYEQSHLVELDLAEINDASSPYQIWNIAKLVAGLKRGQKLIVQGRPGTGKTMTLLQAAQSMSQDSTAPVPLVVAVSSWAPSGRHLSAYVEELLAAHGVERADVPRLFHTGRLALLLNGWNEAPESSLPNAERLLKEFDVNYPGTPILLTTRATRSRPALVGETVLDIRPLSRARKIQMIRAAGLPNPDTVIAQVSGRLSLDRITDTPLFLAVALRLVRSGVELPETRSGLLQQCIAEVENHDEHRPFLNAAPCHGFQGEYLAAIAVAMTHRGRTTLPPTEVEAAIADCNRRLCDAGHLSHHGSSSAIADTLVRHHLLVLSTSGDGSHTFVHQQFQECFAAVWLLDRIRELTASNSAPKILQFQQEILNLQQWGESMGFAVENLVASGAEDTAATLIRWTMPVDLLAAAELAGLGGPALWASIGRELCPALRRWHSRQGTSHQKCAMAAMVATGSPDFADILWAKLEAADEQEFFGPLRAYPLFRTSCLGPGWQERILRLSECRQKIFLSEMGRQSGSEELDFARHVAVSSASIAVKNKAIEMLVERRLGTESIGLVQSAEFGPWNLDTYHVFNRIPVADLAPLYPRLELELDRERDPCVRLEIIGKLKKLGHSRWLELAQREIDAIVAARRQITPVRVRATNSPADERTTLGFLIVSYASLIGAVEPLWVENWLIAHVADGLLWEHPLVERVPGFSEDHCVLLAEAQLQSPRNHRSTERMRLLAGTGSTGVAETLLNAYLASEENSRIDRRDMLREVPAAALAGPASAKAVAASTFAERLALLEALEFIPSLRDGLQHDQQDCLRQLAFEIAANIPADYPYVPHLRASLAAFLGRIGRPEDVSQIEALAATETARWEVIRREVAETRRTGRSRPMRRDKTGFSNIYVNAMMDLSCAEAETALRRWLEQPDMLREAARGLVLISRREGLLPKAPSPMDQRVGIPRIEPFTPGAVIRDRSEAIHRAIEAHRAAGSPAQSVHRPDIIGAASAMALLHDPRSVDLLLGANMRYGGWTVIEHLHLLVRHGTVLPGRRVLEVLEPFIAEGERLTMHSANDPWYAIVKACAILLASDDPAAAVERMRQLPAARLQNHYGRDLFAVLAVCPKPEAGEYLIELSRTLSPDAPSYPDLIDALSANSNPVCRTRLLEMAVEPAAQHTRDAFRRSFVQLEQNDPNFVRALRERLLTLGERELALFLVHLSDLESKAAMEMLLELSDLRPVYGMLHRMLRYACHSRVPVNGAGGYHLVPRAVNTVRRKLAVHLVSDSVENRSIAASLLASIQKFRLDYGQPMDELLHPDATLLPEIAGPWSLAF
jgi:hypothetical protein